MLGKRVFVYDAPGSFDRYTVAATIGHLRCFFAMADDPYSPLGFNLFIGDSRDKDYQSGERKYFEGKHLGKKLSYIPMHLVNAIKDRITY